MRTAIDEPTGTPAPAPQRKKTRRKKRRGTTRRAPDVMQSPRKEVHSGDFQIGQHSPITEKTTAEDIGREKFDRRAFGHRLKEYAGDIIKLDGIEVTEDYLAELAFYEEPLTIIINASTHKNAASIYENWSNGRGAEMFIKGQWVIVQNLPIGQPITVKRKIVEHIIRARVMNVQTIHEEPPVASPRNEMVRQSTPVHSFSILKDTSPRGQQWLEMAYARPI